MHSRETALIFGVGPGLGVALANRFASAKMQVCAVARDEARLKSPIKLRRSHDVRPYVADFSNCEDVLRVFDCADRDMGQPDVVVSNAGVFQRSNIKNIDPADFERCRRIGCLGGLLVGQAAARRGQARPWNHHLYWRHCFTAR